MIECILTLGCPSSGKSTWAKAEVDKDPLNWVRVNNDDLRLMTGGSGWLSKDYEKIITDTRNYLIREALKNNKNVIIDNLNINKTHWTSICAIAKDLNIDVRVSEKIFYLDLEELIARDSKRTGISCVGEPVIYKWWKESGKESLKTRKPRSEIFMKIKNDNPIKRGPIKAIMVDLDGTVSLFNKPGEQKMHEGVHFRNPYDASTCSNDGLNKPVAEVINKFYKDGYKILFCSGRKEEYRSGTLEFLNKHFNIEFDLFMRKTDDSRKDSIIKSEIYFNNINEKYDVLFVLDDRSSVCEEWRSMGLTCFQVAAGDF